MANSAFRPEVAAQIREAQYWELIEERYGPLDRLERERDHRPLPPPLRPLPARRRKPAPKKGRAADGA